MTQNSENLFEGTISIPIAKLKSKNGNAKKYRELEALAQSLSVEQHTPIIVGPMDDEGNYPVLKGERRLRAAQIAGLKALRGRVVEKIDISPTNNQLLMLSENLLRPEITTEDIVNAVNELLAQGVSIEEISETLGESEEWVKSHIRGNNCG